MIAVGCPVYRREWILPAWFDHVNAAFDAVGLEPTFMFAADLRDETTHACLVAHADMSDRAIFIKGVHDNIDRPEKREWTDRRRIEHMVDVRNALLHMVRRYRPTAFLSVDSDILLTPQALEGMLENLDRFSAVGSKVYLSKAGTRCPSYAKLRNGRLWREDVDYVKPVDVLMAVKMMNPCAYDIDYEFDRNGEDIGWSRAATAAGLTLGFDGRFASKHVWGEEFLGRFDKRVGY